MADNEQQELSLPDLELAHGIDSMDLTIEHADSGGVVETSDPQQGRGIATEFPDSEDMQEEDSLSPKPSESSKGKKKFQQLSRVDNGDVGDIPTPSPTKKPRISSIFGGPTDEMDEDQATPKTTDMGIGLRMTNLNLDQQADESEVYNDVPHRSIIPGPNPDLVDGNEPDRPLDSSHEDGSGDQADILTCSGDPGPFKSYELRRNVNRLGAESTHIDLDQSGDYDPVEEARSRSSRAAIAKRTKRSQEAKKDNEKNKRFSGKGNTVPISDQDIGFKGIVKLSFKAMDKVVGITTGVYRIPHSQRASHTRIPDPAGEENDLTGHPVARGCKKCRLEDIECSMISDGRYPCSSCQNGKFECQRIVETIATERCERCERYDQPDSFENAKDKVPDSISHGVIGQPRAACNGYLEAGGLHCKAKSPKRPKSDRIDLNQILYSKDRNWKDCTHCRALKKRCSLKKKSDKPPCNQCRRGKIGCHFYDVTSYERSKLVGGQERKSDEEQAAEENTTKANPTLLDKIASECSTMGPDFFSPQDIAYMRHEKSPQEDETQEPEPEEPVMMTDVAGHHGLLTKIKTSFAHPMVFSVVPNPDAVQDCNFCEIPVFGMVGHFEREVAVIQWENGLGYTEIMNGHREDHGPTTMCEMCAYQRLQIMMCPDHRLHKMMVENEVGFDSAAEELIITEGRTAAMQEQLQRWCSLCFSLATHMCCTSQPSVSAGEEGVDLSELEGCGLRLCDECAHKLVQIYDNSLDTMATVFDEISKPKEKDDDDDSEIGEETPTEANEKSSVRADVGLLRMDGLLMNLVKSMGE